jgi:modulator of FtsH protease HflK
MSEAGHSIMTPEWQKRLKRQVLRALAVSALALGCIYLLSGITVIQPEEQAIVVRFGRLTEAPLLPGTHYVLPWLADKVHVFKPNEVKDVTIGISGQFNFSRDRLNKASFRGVNLGPEFLTGDENIILLEMNAQFKISDAGRYLFHSVDADRLVVIACEKALARETARTHVDNILTSGRQVLLARVREAAQKELDVLGAGVALMSINLSRAAPPVMVADAFKDVASALEDRDRYINEASGHYNEAIPMVRGEYERIVQEAMAEKESAVNRARGEAARFLNTLAELRQSASPDLAVLRIYLENMETLLPGLRKYVVDAGRE